MLTVFWVLGSMLLMLLIHFLLPLGYTTKGKFVVVVSSGLLALGGLAATTVVPVWQTLVILLLLSFLAAYFMDSRLGKVMNMSKEQFIEEEDIEHSDSPINLTNQTQKTSDIELIDLAELEITAPTSVIKIDENTIPDDSLDEDISFLEDRKINNATEEKFENDELEVSYLSDLESLLEEGTEEKVELPEEKVKSIDEDGWLDELAELTIDKNEDKIMTEESTLRDFELEELFAYKEVAAAKTSDKDESKPLKILELKK